MTTEFRIGRVLGTGFRIWAKNVLPFVLLTALAHSPMMIWGASIIHEGTWREHMAQFSNFQGASIWMMLPLNLLASGLLTYGVTMELQGQHASFGTCLTKGFARFFPSLGTTISACLCIGGAVFCVGIAFVFINQVLMLIVMLVVMLYLLSMLSASASASALERSGMVTALGRSRALTRGHKLAILILLILLALIHFACEVLVDAVMFSGKHGPGQGLFTSGVYVTLGFEVIVGSISAVMASVAYYFLRAEKEGTSATELAAVFG